MNKAPQILLSEGIFKEKPVVFIDFEFNWDIVNQLRSFSNAIYIPPEKRWFIAKNNFNLHQFFNCFNSYAFIDYSQLKQTLTIPRDKKPVYNINQFKRQLTPKTKEKIDELRKWMEQVRYSSNTIKTYIHHLEIFFGFYCKTDPEFISEKDIIAFNHEFIIRNQLSTTFQNQTISALKKFYHVHLNKKLDIENFERPIKSQPLPKVFAQKELQQFLACITNPKHKMAFETIYAYGLRRGELLNLKLEHINRHTGLISIINAKGKKDRLIPISKRWMDKLIPYYKEKKPLVYVIEGQHPGKSISATSLQKVFERKLKKSKIKRHYTLHSLRHSIATHMLENGTNLRYIQEFLGHKSSKTTEIYTHVSNDSLKNIKNPFDDMDI